MVEFIDQAPKAAVATQWKEALHLLPIPLSEALKPRSWKRLYNTETLAKALSRVRIVGYDEKIVSLFFIIVGFTVNLVFTCLKSTFTSYLEY